MAVFCHTEEMRYFIIALLGLSLFIPHTVNAQRLKQTSNEEDIAIAFYKTGNINPDLESWVENSNIYKNTPLARRDEMMQIELQRLASKYSVFNPAEDYLVVHTKARILPIEEVDPIDKSKTYFIDVNFAKEPDAFFFPYTYHEHHFAVMPFSLDEILRQEVTAEEYQRIDDITKKKDKYAFVIRLKTREAVTTAPVLFADLHYWVLKADIVSAEVWKSDGTLVWEYTLPGFMTKEGKVLNNLYDLKDESISPYGVVKPVNIE